MRRPIMSPRAAALALALATLACGGGSSPRGPDYSGAWRDPAGREFAEIGRALVRHGARDCGEYQVEPNANRPAGSEYRVRCTRDGSTFSYYLVRPGSGSVDGPAASF